MVVVVVVVAVLVGGVMMGIMPSRAMMDMVMQGRLVIFSIMVVTTMVLPLSSTVDGEGTNPIVTMIVAMTMMVMTAMTLMLSVRTLLAMFLHVEVKDGEW